MKVICKRKAKEIDGGNLRIGSFDKNFENIYSVYLIFFCLIDRLTWLLCIRNKNNYQYMILRSVIIIQYNLVYLHLTAPVPILIILLGLLTLLIIQIPKIIQIG